MSFDPWNDQSSTAELELVQRAQAGDRRAFEALVRRHRGVVVAMAQKYVKNPDAAEDVAQEALLTAFRDIGGFRGQSSFRTWLLGITVNRAKAYRRTATSRGETQEIDETIEEYRPARTDDPGRTLSRRELGREINAAIARLKPIYREVLLDFYRDGLSQREIAEKRGLYLHNVKSRLATAVEQVGVQLRPYLRGRTALGGLGAGLAGWHGQLLADIIRGAR